ncbi:hypothetical protein BC829DRAFT_441314 [Chytridium lagenaria]|nr:hypothetical protein BC829DRAFT_441314 [Chytridium lagenaria]
MVEGSRLREVSDFGRSRYLETTCHVYTSPDKESVKPNQCTRYSDSPRDEKHLTQAQIGKLGDNTFLWILEVAKTLSESVVTHRRTTAKPSRRPRADEALDPGTFVPQLEHHVGENRRMRRFRLIPGKVLEVRTEIARHKSLSREELFQPGQLLTSNWKQHDALP